MSKKNYCLANLHYPNNVGWLCGDYFYYAFKSEVSSNFYWLIEPDVDFGNKCHDFFGKSNDDPADFLAIRLSKKKSSWYWQESMVFYSEDVYGCSFPITRLSNGAISELLSKREMVSQKYVKGDIDKYPNDEAFVSTVLLNEEYSYKDIMEVYPCNYSEFSTTVPRLWKALVDEDKVCHPVLEWDDFCAKYPSRLNSALSNGTHSNFIASSIKGLTSEEVSKIMVRSFDIFKKYAHLLE